MGWMPTEAELDAGGGTPREETPPPALTAGGDEELSPIVVLQDTRLRLLVALADPATPPGTVSNILSSLAKVAIALSEIEHAYEPPQVVFIDPHDDQWHDVHLLLTRAFTRIMELHQEAEAVLGELDTELTRFDHSVAVRTRQTLRLATRHFHTGLAEEARKAARAGTSPQP